MNEDYKKKKLSIGFLFDSFDVEAWVYELIRYIKDMDCVKIDLIVLNGNLSAAQKMTKKNFLSKILEVRRYLLYIIYWKWENARFKIDNDAFAIKNINDLLKGTPILKTRPKQAGFFDIFDDRDIEKIEEYKIDIFIRFGFRLLKGKILKSSRFGIWSYHHGDNCVNRGGPPAFWEVLENQPVTGSILQILTEDLDNGTVLCRSYSTTNKLSVKYNRNNLYWRSMLFIPRKLKELYELGEKDFFNRVKLENKPITFYCDRLYKTPTNKELISFLIKHIAKCIKHKFNNLFFLDQWILMFDMCEGISGSFWRFKKIIPPKDRFWADPFIVYRNNLYYIFIEEFLYKSRKGHISLITMDQKGKYSDPVKIIEKPYNLSYPFIFEWNNDYYMIPESVENKTIEVYKCIDFPNRWEFCKNLMTGVMALDSTVFYYQNKWWLFANIRKMEEIPLGEELFLFYSDSPLSDNWSSHPKNPIVSDINRARPAGRIFEYNYSFYRPSQDCSRCYGYGLKINQIITLNETEYKEAETNYIEPRWDKRLKGIHTFNHEGRLTFIDAILRRLK